MQFTDGQRRSTHGVHSFLLDSGGFLKDFEAFSEKVWGGESPLV